MENSTIITRMTAFRHQGESRPVSWFGESILSSSKRNEIEWISFVYPAPHVGNQQRPALQGADGMVFTGFEHQKGVRTDSLLLTLPTCKNASPA